MYKEDLDLPNHLVGLKQKYLKLNFLTITDLTKVRNEIMTTVKKTKERMKSTTAYSELLAESLTERKGSRASNALENIIDMREFDVPFHVRVSIDKAIFVGTWYQVT